MAEAVDLNVERLARKLIADGHPSATDMDSAMRAARALLAESEERTFDEAAHDHENADKIRRSSSETAATGDSVGTKYSNDGD